MCGFCYITQNQPNSYRSLHVHSAYSMNQLFTFSIAFLKNTSKNTFTSKKINVYHFGGIGKSKFKISLPFERQIKGRHLKIYLSSFHFKHALSTLNSNDTPG